MRYKITGLPADQFRKYFSMSAEELDLEGVRGAVADDTEPGYPCRVSLAHATSGERLILINYEHLPVASPYRSAHAIYVAENSLTDTTVIDKIPAPIRQRVLSVRAFDAAHMMVDADIIDGSRVEQLITQYLANPDVDYLHVHYAKRGCFAARVERVA